MKLTGLLPFLHKVVAYQQLKDRLLALEAQPPLALIAAARAYVAAVLALDLNRPLLLLAARSEDARQLTEALRIWLPDERPVFHFLNPDALPYERISWSQETIQARLRALTALVVARQPGSAGRGAPAPIVVASARALIHITLPVRELRLALRPLRHGQIIDLDKLLTTWIGLGYVSTSVVEAPGTFSRRGGIIDVFPPNLDWPLRLELFGDEVDSLRTFDPSTQRTREHIEEALIGPASEALPKRGPQALPRLESLDCSPCHPPARNDFEREREQLARGEGFRGIEWYLPYLYSQPATLLDYLPPTGLILVDDGADLAVTVSDLTGQAERLRYDLLAAGDLPEGALVPYLNWPELREQLEARPALILGYGELSGRPTPLVSTLAKAFLPGPRYGGQVRRVIEETKEILSGGDRVVMVTRQAPRMAELFTEAGRPVNIVQDVIVPPPPSSLSIVHSTFAEGFILKNSSDTSELWFLTDAELFGWSRPRVQRLRRRRPMAPEAFFADVKPGDYVVHLEHGIGVFRGLVKRKVNGTEREYLQVDYAQGDRLYVPVHQADRLSRYVGPGDAPPVLHRLGTADWELVKKRARKAVADIAQELLELYATRELARGHAFSPDSTWQAELEAAFPYVETEDQLQAIQQVKQDMEKPRPMDRLICGDVGYGKTEVALRAAFKAVMDGKQVAMLVPTTVLAQQHFRTFNERLNPFPVNVAMLSRFLTRARQREVLEGLASGAIDIVIGTHRLLSKDVQFKDLGLLIVDEEQRFGVAHKERLKQLRTEIDVLTLTATPIPRTLHMGLSGVRDLSTIDTPPEERLPIKTVVAEYDEQLIRQAILRELDRGGQVYFVHNRVQGIEQIANRVRRIVPEASVVVAHGQMPERELERVMLEFANGEYDVLVCTTIIESGLDIPNVNTIIINRADQFGLAQLYQLRGRVGRSAVRSYAYLLYDRYHTLNPAARRRLEAIHEASELGAGFRIAMQDLEIRGAGELLGARQHGHIAAIGFDLYSRLLAQAVQELREKKGQGGSGGHHGNGKPTWNDPLAPSVAIDLPIAASIPEDYVPDASLRLQLYRRMASLCNPDEIAEMRQELEDRFGAPPTEVENLLLQVRIKLLAQQAGVRSISREEKQLAIHSDALENLDQGVLQRQLGAKVRIGRQAIWLSIDEKGHWQQALVRLLERLRALSVSSLSKGER